MHHLMLSMMPYIRRHLTFCTAPRAAVQKVGFAGQGRPWWSTPLPHIVGRLEGLVLVGGTP
jgi:hypothetical protein